MIVFTVEALGSWEINAFPSGLFAIWDTADACGNAFGYSVRSLNSNAALSAEASLSRLFNSLRA